MKTEEDGMIETKKIQHIGLIVPDADVAAKWYLDTAGFVRKAEFRTGSGVRAVFVHSEKMDLLYELIQHPRGSDIAQRAEICGGWLDHVAFEVEDLEKEFEKAKAQELIIIEGIVDIPEFWDRGFRYFLLRSPGGEKVEFCKVL
jgi:catechol 2,3-dioxygenase-like lactoylglutathione lyase family enzyme